MSRAISAPVSVRVIAAASTDDLRPQWVKNTPLNEWREIPNTDVRRVQTGLVSLPTGGPHLMYADCGATLKRKGSEIFVNGGGHGDYHGNEVYSIKLNAEIPQWVRRTDPTPPELIPWRVSDVAKSAYYDDGKPAARHSYWNIQYIDSLDRMFQFGAPAVFGDGSTGFLATDAFNPNTNTWAPAGTYADSPTRATAIGIVKTDRDEVFVHLFSDWGPMYKWTPQTMAWEFLGNRMPYNEFTPYCHDPVRDRVVRTRSGAVSASWFTTDTGARTDFEYTGEFAAKADNMSGMTYCEALDCFLLRRYHFDPDVYRIDPVTWEVTKFPLTGTPAPIRTDGLARSMARFVYVPELKIVIMNTGVVALNLYYFRVA